jgi:adenylyltransferase/sulfurtransferase
MTTEITVQDLKRRLDAKETVTLLDVRDDWETKLARLEHAAHIPVTEIEHRLDELDPNDEIVVYCHHGIRSAAVADFLRRAGYPKAVNLAGGLDHWAQVVDPSMRRY